MEQQRLEAQTFDPIWEEKYKQGHSQRYPWDIVVSFVFRYFPRNKPRNQINILEVGCGSGSNLWFAAREGFQVAGIDGSSSAIAYAQKRFAEDGLLGDLRVGDFTNLPFSNDTFDLVIDRGAITCCSQSAARQAIAEIWRVLMKGGKFLCNPYSDRHSSFLSGPTVTDGLTVNISAGTLVNTGQIYFYSRREVDTLFAQGWELLSRQHIEVLEEVQSHFAVHAEWRVIVAKQT